MKAKQAVVRLLREKAETQLSLQDEYNAMKVEVTNRSKTRQAASEQDASSELPGASNKPPQVPMKPESFNKALAHLNKQK